MLVKSIEKSKVMFCAGNSELRVNDIKRGVFQRDSVSPLVLVLALVSAYEFSGDKEKINYFLFMDYLKLYSRNEKELDSLVQTKCGFIEDIEIDFGIEKCAMVVIDKGKIVKSVGIELPDGKAIKSIQEGESYKHLETLEADRFLGEEMKLKGKRLKKVLKSKLNSGNLV